MRYTLLYTLTLCLIGTNMLVAQQRANTTPANSPYVDTPGAPVVLTRTQQYNTGFEVAQGFAAGNINGQDGWFGQFGLFNVAANNPFTGVQNFNSISDGFGVAFASSPQFAIGIDPNSSAEAYVSITPNTTVSWQFSPQSPTAGLVVTRVQFNTLGAIEALIDDGFGGPVFVNTGVSTPAGYFLIGVSAERATNIFTVYLNNNPIFTGLGFAGDVETVVVRSGMEVAGPTFDMDDMTLNDGPLPVELMRFDAFADGDDVQLSWETASEVNNAGFEIQTRLRVADGRAEWRMLDWVEGVGTTTEAQSYSYRVKDMEPGTHQFRLRQVDFDGQFDYSPMAEVTIEVPGTHRLYGAYPNPFNPQSFVNFVVAAEQPVRMELFNVFGQQVQTLYEGTPAANELQQVRIDGSNLPSGTYMVRLTGPGFQETQSVTLIK